MCTLALFPFDCSPPWSILEAGMEAGELAGTSGSHVANVGDMARQLGRGRWLQAKLMSSKEKQTINWLELLRGHQKKLDKID